MGGFRKNVGGFRKNVGGVEKTWEIFEKTLEFFGETLEFFGETLEIFFYHLQHHWMRSGVVLHFLLSSRIVVLYFSPQLLVVHDASARVCFLSVVKGHG